MTLEERAALLSVYRSHRLSRQDLRGYFKRNKILKKVIRIDKPTKLRTRAEYHALFLDSKRKITKANTENKRVVMWTKFSLTTPQFKLLHTVIRILMFITGLLRRTLIKWEPVSLSPKPLALKVFISRKNLSKTSTSSRYFHQYSIMEPIVLFLVTMLATTKHGR